MRGGLLKEKYFFFGDQDNRFAPGRNRHRIGDCPFAAFRGGARFQSLDCREMDLCDAMELWRSLRGATILLATILVLQASFSTAMGTCSFRLKRPPCPN